MRICYQEAGAGVDYCLVGLSFFSDDHKENNYMVGKKLTSENERSD